jgi:uncharacterized membrane protein
MSDLVAVAFDTPQEADNALTELKRLQKEYLIEFADAVVVIRQPDGKVHLKQSIDMVGVGAASGGLSGGLWGMLVGLLFLNPLVGFAIGGIVGAGSGALAGKLTDFGIDDKFIRSLAQTLQPGNSALFVLIRKVQPERVLAEMKRFKGRVLRTSLSAEQENRLRAALSDATATVAV